MDNLLIYILKTTLSLSLLYLVYILLFRRETFLVFNRAFLILSALLSFILPHISLPLPFDLNEDQIHHLSLDRLLSEIPENSYNLVYHQSGSTPIYSGTDHFGTVLGIIYLLGVFVYLLLFLFHLYQISRVGENYTSEYLNGINIVKTTGNLSPFSFFKTIYIDKEKFRPLDLHQIIIHEKVHINERHTFDLLFFELMKAIHWFNPIIWLMARSMKETHEFIADRAVINGGHNSIAYQYLIIKQSVGLRAFSMVNTFSHSQIKRRINMLNKARSKNKSLFKILFIIPVLILLLTIFHVPGTALEVPSINNTISVFHPPLHSGRLTVGFEEMINPFTKKAVFHKGWDIAAPQGTKIYACQSGTVVEADSVKGYGNRIVINHSQGYTTLYSHLLKIMVSKKQVVKIGEIIGLVGNTGLSTAPHLHFELQLNKKVIDPGEKLDISVYSNKQY